MATQSESKKIDKEAITHTLTGITVALKGIDKIENIEKFWFGLILILIGLGILALGIFHHQIEHKIRNAKAIVFLAESFVLSLVGYLYLHEHKTYIQYVCFAASLGFLIAGIRAFFTKRNE